MSTLWMAIEPRETETRLQLTEAGRGLVLRGRMPTVPAHPLALAHLLEALSDWYGQPLTAVLDADAQDVVQRPTFYARMLGELDGQRIRVQWARPLRKAFRRDRYLGALGDFRRARELVTFTGTGLP
jgi:hypothetical protein